MENFWHHPHSSAVDITLSQVGYEVYHAHSSMRHYTVKQKWVIHYILSGKGELRINNIAYPLQAGQLFYFFQGQKVTYFADKRDPWTLVWLGIQGHDLLTFLQQTTLPRQNVLTLSNRHAITQKLQTIVYRNKEYIDDCDQIKNIANTALLFDFLSEIQKNFTLPQPKEKSATQHNIIEYVSNHYMEKITPQTIASYFNISYSQLYKLCMQTCHESPKKMITQCRIRQAVDLLLHSNNTIKEIAQKVGYHDEFLFSKTFKKEIGYSPSTFRKLDNKQDSDIYFK